MSKNRIQFVDKIKIFTKAGKGGNGCSSFRREKHVSKGGPNGGNGGNGSTIVFQASHNERSLLQYKMAPHLKSPNGDHGKGSSMHSKNMPNKVFLMPIGTQIFDSEHQELLYDLNEEGMQFVAAQGGKGGYGNEHYKTPTDQAPTYAQPGTLGEENTYVLQLKILADIGIIGEPNAGKSSLLRSISKATPEVANYPFTTINPQLGTVLKNDKTLVFADIPGLIEFASLGKGLGHNFLSHIERCKTLLHLIDINTDIVKSYDMIRKELGEYSHKLLEKPEIIALSKTDWMHEDDIRTKVNEMKKHIPNSVVLTISNVSKQGIDELLTTCFNKHYK